MRKRCISALLAVIMIFVCTSAMALDCEVENHTSAVWSVSFYSRMDHGGLIKVMPKSKKSKSTSWGASIKEVRVIREDTGQVCPDCPDLEKCEYLPDTPSRGLKIDVKIKNNAIIIKKAGGDLLKTCK